MCDEYNCIGFFRCIGYLFLFAALAAFAVLTAPFWLPISICSFCFTGKCWFYGWSSTPTAASSPIPSMDPRIGRNTITPEPATSTNKYVITIETVSNNNLDHAATKLKLQNAVELAMNETTIKEEIFK